MQKPSTDNATSLSPSVGIGRHVPRSWRNSVGAQQLAGTMHRTLGRLRLFPIGPVTLAPRSVDSKLGDSAAGFQRLGSIGADAGHDDEIAVGLHARRHRPF